MSNIKKAVVRFNGQELVATYDTQTQLWTATATAPSTSSYGQPDHVYKAEVFAEDQAGNSASVNSSDATYGAQLKIRVLEKTKPEGVIRTPSNGSVLGVNTQNVLIAINSTDHHPFEVTNALWSLTNGDTIEASGDCEVQAIRSDYTVLKAKIQPMIANNVYTLRFSYDVNDEHLEQDVTVRVK